MAFNLFLMGTPPLHYIHTLRWWIRQVHYGHRRRFKYKGVHGKETFWKIFVEIYFGFAMRFHLSEGGYIDINGCSNLSVSWDVDESREYWRDCNEIPACDCKLDTNGDQLMIMTQELGKGHTLTNLIRLRNNWLTYYTWLSICQVIYGIIKNDLKLCGYYSSTVVFSYS